MKRLFYFLSLLKQLAANVKLTSIVIPEGFT